MYKVIESIKCFTLCYFMCDYYSFNYHLSKTILTETSLKSHNFIQKRKIRDVLNANIAKW